MVPGETTASEASSRSLLLALPTVENSADSQESKSSVGSLAAEASCSELFLCFSTCPSPRWKTHCTHIPWLKLGLPGSPAVGDFKLLECRSSGFNPGWGTKIPSMPTWQKIRCPEVHPGEPELPFP